MIEQPRSARLAPVDFARARDSLARAELLDHSRRYAFPPPERRVFVNRSLRMETIRHVGFDLDWTLADYRRLPIEELTFRLAIDRLIDGHGYPEEVREAELRPEFPRRGLLIDRQAGTVLRMNRHRYVGRAYLGRRRLKRRDMIRLYRMEPINPSSDRFYHVDSLFELPETNLYSELVELGARRPSLGLPDYARLFEDVRAAVDWVHGSGTLKEPILARPESFLWRDPELALALLRLALGGRKLLLLTNSGWTYAAGLCSYLFDGLLPGLDSWRQLFDLVIVGARKPDFFRRQEPFQPLDAAGRPAGEVEIPSWGGAYSGGCQEGLMRLLGDRGEHVLYVGDHIYADVVTSKRRTTWRTVLIVSELEQEQRRRAELTTEVARQLELQRRLEKLGHEMDQLQDIAGLFRRTGGDGEREQGALAEIERALQDVTAQHQNVFRRAARLGERIAYRFNPYWGSFFKQGTSKTLFAHQIESYACLYTSRVSNLGLYGSKHYHRVIEDPMMHEWNGA